MADPRRALGARGEELAARHLEARGYQVVERNFRTRYGELDVVARDARFLVFCEVKTRVVRDGAGASDVLGPFATIGPRKQRQVRGIAAAWLAAGEERPRSRDLRFDVVAVTVDRAGRLVRLDHLEAAF